MMERWCAAGSWCTGQRKMQPQAVSRACRALKWRTAPCIHRTSRGRGPSARCSHCNRHTGVVIVTAIITTTINTICNAIRDAVRNAIRNAIYFCNAICNVI
jgi:hypothetical protein